VIKAYRAMSLEAYQKNTSNMIWFLRYWGALLLRHDIEYENFADTAALDEKKDK